MPVRLHLRQIIRNDVVDRTAPATGRLPETRSVGVAFVDLVRPTQPSERLAVEDLLPVTQRLEPLASASAAPPVRLINSSATPPCSSRRTSWRS
jgi:hypothetical protein